MLCNGVGEVKLVIVVNGYSETVVIQDAMYILNLCNNMFSVSKINDWNLIVLFDREHCILHNNPIFKISGRIKVTSSQYLVCICI